MYIRRPHRRRLSYAVWLLAALVLFMPKIDLSTPPQLTALLSAVGLGQVQAG